MYILYIYINTTIIYLKTTYSFLYLLHQVFDEHGQDVTPRPLCNPEPGVLQSKQGKIFPAHDTSSWTTMTDFPSVAFQTTNASITGPFTR